MGGYGIYMAIASFISAIAGGGIVQLFNIKSNKKKAGYEAETAGAMADSALIKNVKEAILVYKETADDLKKELESYREKLEELTKQSEAMKKEIKALIARVSKLSATIQKIPKMLNCITHENMEMMVKKINDEIAKQNIQQD